MPWWVRGRGVFGVARTRRETAMTETTGPDVPAHRYTAALAGQIEQRWQDHWADQGTFHAPNPVGPLAVEGQPVPSDKLFVQDMFPYPSGSGLHVGHPLGFISTDVFARYHRMIGRNVLHTMGFDAFGLPAEQYAVQTGQHPRKTTEENIRTYLRQIRRLGLGHDERRRISTIDPEYYRWTQWIFLRIFNSWYDTEAGKARPIAELEAAFADGSRPTPDGRDWASLSASERKKVIDDHRLVYISEAPVNWCPGLGTVLSNEEVTADGRSERGNFPVFRRNLRQWMMRITAYADRLVDDLDLLDWPEKVKSMQRNWIGRSHGARVTFKTGDDAIEVFTTRPDTLFGATYMVLAPEHPLVDKLTAAAWAEGVDERWTAGAATPAEAIKEYRVAASRKSELDRQENKEKTGVFTGAFATNPVNDKPIPIFVADYVLMGYGTGAIMAVPAHDQRDFEFAQEFELPIRCVIQPPMTWLEEQGVSSEVEANEWNEAFVGNGVATASTNDEVSLDGLDVADAKQRIADWLEAQQLGAATVPYKLRDWLFSRQRYWGEPFPIVFDEHDLPVAVPASMLPVELPEIIDFEPEIVADDAESVPLPPLARADDWVTVSLDVPLPDWADDGSGSSGPKTYRRELNTMPQWAGS